MTNTKWCPDCRIKRPLDQWGSHRSTADGLQYRCKPCTNASMRISRERKRVATEWALQQLAEEHKTELDELIALRQQQLRERAS